MNNLGNLNRLGYHGRNLIVMNYPNASKLRVAESKYRVAGLGFMVLSAIYLLLVFVFLPAFQWTFSTLVSIIAYLLIMGSLSFFIFQGKSLLVKILMVIYGFRTAYSIYTILSGNSVVVVPYVLPVLVTSFYLLGRAVWDWP